MTFDQLYEECLKLEIGQTKEFALEVQPNALNAATLGMRLACERQDCAFSFAWGNKSVTVGAKAPAEREAVSRS